MIELFRTDSRFHVVVRQRLELNQAQKVIFQLGRSVPVLGAVTYDRDGRAVQSIEYRSSSVILIFNLQLKNNAIDLKINQQLSNFVKTDTALITDLNKTRHCHRCNVKKSGDIVVLGGLAENKITEGETGFSFYLKAFLSGRSKNKFKD